MFNFDVNSVFGNLVYSDHSTVGWIFDSPGIHSVSAVVDDYYGKQYTRTKSIYVFPNSLAGYWKFDESSGTTASDSSGNGNTGTLTSGASFTSGKFGNAVSLNGINNYVSFANSPTLSTGSVTVSMWVNLASNPDCDSKINWRTLIRKGLTYGTDTGWDVGLEENRELTWDIGTGIVNYNRLFSSTQIPVGTWTHVAFTYDSNSGYQRIYVNGNSVANRIVTVGTMQSNTNPVLLSGGSNAVTCPNGFGYFNGTVDSLRIYNRALTSQEINDTSKNLYP